MAEGIGIESVVYTDFNPSEESQDEFVARTVSHIKQLQALAEEVAAGGGGNRAQIAAPKEAVSAINTKAKQLAALGPDNGGISAEAAAALNSAARSATASLNAVANQLSVASDSELRRATLQSTPTTPRGAQQSTTRVSNQVAKLGAEGKAVPQSIMDENFAQLQVAASKGVITAEKVEVLYAQMYDAAVRSGAIAEELSQKQIQNSVRTHARATGTDEASVDRTAQNNVEGNHIGHTTGIKENTPDGARDALDQELIAEDRMTVQETIALNRVLHSWRDALDEAATSTLASTTMIDESTGAQVSLREAYLLRAKALLEENSLMAGVKGEAAAGITPEQVGRLGLAQSQLKTQSNLVGASASEATAASPEAMTAANKLLLAKVDEQLALSENMTIEMQQQLVARKAQLKLITETVAADARTAEAESKSSQTIRNRNATSASTVAAKNAEFRAGNPIIGANTAAERVGNAGADLSTEKALTDAQREELASIKAMIGQFDAVQGALNAVAKLQATLADASGAYATALGISADSKLKMAAIDDKIAAAALTQNAELVGATRAQITTANARAKASEEKALVDSESIKVEVGLIAATAKRTAVTDEAVAVDEHTINALAQQKVAATNRNLAVNSRAADINAGGEPPSWTQRFTALVTRLTSGNNANPNEMPKLGSQFGSQFTRTAGYALSGAVLFGAVNGIKTMMKDAESLQKQLVILKAQFDSASDSGKELGGVSFSGLVKQISDVAVQTNTDIPTALSLTRQLAGAFTPDSGIPDYGAAVGKARDALQLSKVTGLPEKDITDDLVAIATSFKVNFKDIGDSVLGLQNKTGVAAPEIINFMSKIAPMASQVGFNAQQIAGVGALAEQVSGVTGNQLADQMQRVFASIQGHAPDLLEIFNQSSATKKFTPKLATALATNNQKDVLKILSQAYSVMPGDANKGEKSALQGLIGTPHDLSAIYSLLQRPQMLTKALEGKDEGKDAGQLDKYWAQYQQTVEYRLGQLKKEAQKVGEALIQGGVGDAINNFATAAAAVVKVFAFMATGIQKVDELTHGLVGRFISLAVALKAVNIARKAFTGLGAQPLTLTDPLDGTQRTLKKADAVAYRKANSLAPNVTSFDLGKAGSGAAGSGAAGAGAAGAAGAAKIDEATEKKVTTSTDAAVVGLSGEPPVGPAAAGATGAAEISGAVDRNVVGATTETIAGLETADLAAANEIAGEAAGARISGALEAYTAKTAAELEVGIASTPGAVPPVAGEASAPAAGGGFMSGMGTTALFGAALGFMQVYSSVSSQQKKAQDQASASIDDQVKAALARGVSATTIQGAANQAAGGDSFWDGARKLVGVQPSQDIAKKRTAQQIATQSAAALGQMNFNKLIGPGKKGASSIAPFMQQAGVNDDFFTSSYKEGEGYVSHYDPKKYQKALAEFKKKIKSGDTAANKALNAWAEANGKSGDLTAQIKKFFDESTEGKDQALQDAQDKVGDSQAGVDLATAKLQSGGGSMAELNAAYKTLIKSNELMLAAAVKSGDSTQQKTAAQNLVKLHADQSAAIVKQANDQLDIAKLFASLAGNSATDSLANIKTYNTPLLTDPKVVMADKVKAAGEILTAQQAAFSEWVNAAPDAIEKFAREQQGYKLDRSSVKINIVGLLNARRANMTDKMQSLADATGKTTGTLINLIANDITDGTTHQQDMIRADVQSQIALDKIWILGWQKRIKVLKTALGKSGDLLNSRDSTAIIAELNNAGDRLAAAQDKLSGDEKALGEINSVGKDITPPKGTISPEQMASDAKAAHDLVVKNAQDAANGQLEVMKALAAGDPVAEADAAIAQAASDARYLDPTDKGGPGRVQAAMIAAQKQRQAAMEGITSAQLQYQEVVDGNDPMAKARDAVTSAQYALSIAKGDAAKYAAMGQLLQAQRDLGSAAIAGLVEQQNFLGAMSSANNDTIGAAKAQLQVAQLKLQEGIQNGAGSSTLDALKHQVTESMLGVSNAVTQDRLSDINYLYNMGEQTAGQTINALQQMLTTIPEANKSLRQQITQQIHDLRKSLAGDLNFDIPSDVKLPVLYEARRLGQTPTGQSYQDNRQMVFQITEASSAARTAQAVADLIVNSSPTSGSYVAPGLI